MASYVGVDGASSGWATAELDDDGGLAVGFSPIVWNRWYDHDESEVAQVLVGVPIGLPEDGRRECDGEAKECLGDRRSSVFGTPVRDATDEDCVEDAKEIQEERTGYGISNQAWAIVPRIREMDAFLRETDEARSVVRESHPEVCFGALGDGASVGRKSDEDGLDARRKVLTSASSLDPDGCDGGVSTLAEPSYARFAAADDVLDATVLAVAAKRVADGDCSTIPENPPKDAEGLPMEIVSSDT